MEKKRRGLRIVKKNPRALAETALRVAELVEAGMLTEARKYVPDLRKQAERIAKEN